jgi:hypothetical protein
MQGSVFNEGLPSCSWYVNSNKGKLLSAVTKAYFNKVKLHALCSRAAPNASTGISNNVVASNVWFNMFNFLQNSCRWIKFTQNSLESLQDVCTPCVPFPPVQCSYGSAPLFMHICLFAIVAVQVV